MKKNKEKDKEKVRRKQDKMPSADLDEVVFVLQPDGTVKKSDGKNRYPGYQQY